MYFYLCFNRVPPHSPHHPPSTVIYGGSLTKYLYEDLGSEELYVFVKPGATIRSLSNFILNQAPLGFQPENIILHVGTNSIADGGFLS